jgi:hypothetical protein
MTFIVTLLAILQSFAISLGVGSSTLAILNFFSAIADGSIDPTERRMMGIVYVVLRVAMVLILITTLSLLAAEYAEGGTSALSAFSFGQLTALTLLFVNAILMTLHWMPSTFGPAIQAGSWYTLGTLAALQSIDMTSFTYIQFLFGYVAWIVLAIGVVNGTMSFMQQKREERAQRESQD